MMKKASNSSVEKGKTIWKSKGNKAVKNKSKMNNKTRPSKSKPTPKWKTNFQSKI